MNTSAVAGSTSHPILLQAQPSFFCERVKRVALAMLAFISLIGAVFLAARVSIGAISPGYLLAVPALAAAYNYCAVKAYRIRNYNDPNEIRNMQYDLMAWNMTQILQDYTLDRIFQHNLMELDVLRLKCYLSLARETPIITPIVLQHANELLSRRIITPEIHRALVARDYVALSRLPRTLPEIARIYQAFDANQTV